MPANILADNTTTNFQNKSIGSFKELLIVPKYFGFIDKVNSYKYLSVHQPIT